MKHMLAFLAVTALFCGTAVAQITIDGDISDWSATEIVYDDTTDGSVNLEITRWGFQYRGDDTAQDPGYLYWFMETSQDMSQFYGTGPGTHEGWFGLWIDVDHYNAAVSYGWGRTRIFWGTAFYGWIWNDQSQMGIQDGWMPAEWKNGVHQGADINCELGINTTGWGEGWNYWGWGDSAGETKYGDPTWDPISGAMAFSGRILECQVPIDELIDKIQEYPDFQAGGFLNNGKINGLWKAAIRGEGMTGTGSQQDFTQPERGPIIADYNNDGNVSNSDYGVLSNNYGRTNVAWEQGDYSGDGTVSVTDYGFLSNTFGEYMENLGPGAAGGASAVPEPITLVLLGLGGLLLRRRK
jgi:hypothetical protein